MKTTPNENNAISESTVASIVCHMAYKITRNYHHLLDEGAEEYCVSCDVLTILRNHSLQDFIELEPDEVLIDSCAIEDAVRHHYQTCTVRDGWRSWAQSNRNAIDWPILSAIQSVCSIKTSCWSAHSVTAS